MEDFELFINRFIGVSIETLLQALKNSPGANASIIGAVSELLLKQHLEEAGFEVLRIKEKPAGGNKAKNINARGDFYIKKKGSDKDEWLIVESKGLKSNSEFRGAKLDGKVKLFKFLKRLVFTDEETRQKQYDKGKRTYQTEKLKWVEEHPGETFPPFTWKVETAGPGNAFLSGLWKDEQELKEWIEQQDPEIFTEKAYRNCEGAIIVLETHQPSKRVGTITGLTKTAPLVTDFNIMAVDLFFRTRKHEFVFMNPQHISHSPDSPEHLYQNYTIDILVKGKKTEPVIRPPWYRDVDELIRDTKPTPRALDETQLDTRQGYSLSLGELPLDENTDG